MANNNQNQNAIQHGLAAARQAAQEEGMTNKVEELASDLQANAGATAGLEGAATAGMAGANTDALSAVANDHMASDANQELS